MVNLSSLCIVSEFCSNGALNKYVKDHAISKIEMLKIMKGIVAGMVRLAKDNVVHRDLAARNILLDGQLNPKVICKI
jgi:serine/threonine protein kinase